MSTPITPETDASLISVRDVQRVYRRGSRSNVVHALKGVTFDVRRGERFGIVGESGSGKSTLIRLLAALDKPTSGTIYFEDQQVSGKRERELRFLRGQVQVVFQDPMGSLDPRMTVGSIIAEPLREKGLDRGARVVELLEAVGLSRDAVKRYPHQFSGGQRQRISIARALAPKPQVLIADEAVSALDVSVRAQILNLLNNLTRDFNLTLIFVSHDLGVIRHVCDRVAVLNEGELVELGATAEVFNQPQHNYTRTLLRAVPVLRYRPIVAAAASQ